MESIKQKVPQIKICGITQDEEIQWLNEADKPVNKVIQITVSYFFRHKIDFIIRPKKDLRCPLDPVIIQIFLERYTIFFPEHLP